MDESSPADVLLASGGDRRKDADAEEPEAGKIVKTSLFVGGICCASEVPIIERLLSPLPGVASVRTDVTNKRTYVEHDVALVSPAELAGALNAAGLSSSVLDAALLKQRNHLPAWNVMLALVLWLRSCVSYASDPEYLEYFKQVPRHSTSCHAVIDCLCHLG